MLEAIQLLKRAKCFSTIRLSDLFLVTFQYVSSDSHNLLTDRIFFVIVARYCIYRIGHVFVEQPTVPTCLVDNVPMSGTFFQLAYCFHDFSLCHCGRVSFDVF